MAYPDNVTDLTSQVPADGIAAATPLGSGTYPLDDWARATGVTVEAMQTQITGAYTSYSATLTADGTPPTMGTGSTTQGYYKRLGRQVVGYASVVFGAASVAAGSGNYGLLLPVEPVARTQPVGIGYILDSSDNLRLLVATAAVVPTIYSAATSRAVLLTSNTAATGFTTGANPVGATNPWTWAANDQIVINFCYEAAAAS